MTVPPLYSLFHDVDESARAHLLASGLGKPRPGTKNVDLFAGGGGWGLAARRLGLEVHYAINHSKVAIATHAANFPNCVHHQGDAWKVRPRSVVGNDEIDVLFASAACTTHSNARGSVPISKRVHMLGWCIARWIHDKLPRIVVVENVVEWLKWGPLVPVRHANGRVVRDHRGKIVLRPDKTREGQHFKRWVRQCQHLGYVVEWRVMDAADYGEASRRKRLFVQMRRDGAPVIWPEVTHGNALGLSRHRTAADIIDWSDLGRSLFDRKATKDKPWGLAPKSIGRICEGVSRFVLNDADPFVLSTVYGHAPGGGWHVHSINGRMPTQTTRQDLGMCVPVIAPQNTDVYGRPTNEPGPTITTKGHQSLVSPVMAAIGYGERDGQRPRCQTVEEPTTTIVGAGKQGLATPVLAYANQGQVQTGSVEQPLRTVVAGGLHAGLASPVVAEYYGSSKTADAPNTPLGTVVTHDRFGVATPIVSELSAAWTERARTVGRMLKAHLGDRVKLNADGMVEVTLRGIVYVIVDVLFRMLKVHELAAAMGFPSDYRWPLTAKGTINQHEAVKLIGNAISVRNGAALLGAMLPELMRNNMEAVA